MLPTFVEKALYGAVDKCLDVMDLHSGDFFFENYGLNYNLTHNRSFEEIKHSVELGADLGVRIEQTSGKALRILEQALYHPDVRVFEFLLNSGALSGVGRESVLAYATQLNRIDIVSYLLDPKNGYPKRDVDLESALKSAVGDKNHELTELLLKAGADANTTDRQGSPLLCLAAKHQDHTTVKLLLRFGADISRFDSHYRTALSHAAIHGDLELINLLVSGGAILEHPDTQTLTPLLLAVQSGRVEVVKELQSLGASLLARTHHNRSAVDLINGAAHPELLSYLLRFGVKPSTWGVSAIHYEGQTQVADLTEGLLYNDPLTLKRNLENLGVRCGDSKLKSDANIRSDGAALTNFERVIVHAAIVAFIVSNNDQTLCVKNFSELISNDIERVESTKGLSWQKYVDYLDERCKGIQNIKDVIKEVAECVILPTQIRDKRLSVDDKVALDKILQDGAELILRGKSTLDVASINHQWHKATSMVPNDLRPLKALSASWYPLFEEVELSNGYSAKCLTTPRELDEEGKILSHCVGRGGYSSGCLTGLTHIVSIRSEGVPVATLELGLTDRRTKIKTSDGRYWRVVQFHGNYNSTASSDAQNAFDEVLHGIAGEKVKLSGQLGETDESKTFLKCSEAERTMGFLASEIDEYLPKILAHYRERLSVSRGRKEKAVPLIADHPVT